MRVVAAAAPLPRGLLLLRRPPPLLVLGRAAAARLGLGLVVVLLGAPPVARRRLVVLLGVAAPVARRASPVKPKLDPNVVLRPAIASRASPRTDLVRELLGSPSVPTAKAVAEAPLTSAQKTTLKRRTRPKKKLHHAVSTFELAKRSAAKSASRTQFR